MTLLKAPEGYNFGDWNSFHDHCLKYHIALHPNDQLVSDRIATFRSLMSTEVIAYLGSFVRSHPRFNTSWGWDQWAESVSYLLSIRKLLPYLPRPSKCPSVEVAMCRYKQGKTTASEFWQELDELAIEGDISSARQCEVFWSDLRERDRTRITALYPSMESMELQCHLREKPACESHDLNQALSRIMAHLAINDLSRYQRKRLSALIAAMGILVVFNTWWTFFQGYSPRNGCFAALIVTVFTPEIVRQSSRTGELVNRQSTRKEALL